MNTDTTSVIQYPDLTEILSLDREEGGYRQSLDGLDTEFIFYLGNPVHNHTQALKLGLTPLAVMNNWWPAHCKNARKLTFYWAKNRNWSPAHPQLTPTRTKWGIGSYLKGDPCLLFAKYLAASGCGLQIGEPPFKSYCYNRYFTLMRMPLTASKAQVRTLVKNGYKYITTGSLATYYINGFNLSTYSVEAEFKHFGITPEWWAQLWERGKNGN